MLDSVPTTPLTHLSHSPFHSHEQTHRLSSKSSVLLGGPTNKSPQKQALVPRAPPTTPHHDPPTTTSLTYHLRIVGTGEDMQESAEHNDSQHSSQGPVSMVTHIKLIHHEGDTVNLTHHHEGDTEMDNQRKIPLRNMSQSASGGGGVEEESPKVEETTMTLRPSRNLSPSRGGRFTTAAEPLVEEDIGGSDENLTNRGNSGRSGSAGNIVTGFPKFKRSSLHYAHGKKLSRRSSFLVDTACSHPHMNVLPKPLEPIPQPVVVPKRRCSLTLPYPNLYGSWQAAAAACSVPVVKSSSNELSPSGTGGSTLPPRLPPPLLKRRSLAQFDMSRMHSAPPPRPFVPDFRRQATRIPGSLGASTPTVLTISPEADEEAIENEAQTQPPEEQPILPHPPLEQHPPPPPEEGYLISCHLQKIPMKDFGSEVRATLDVAHFLNQAVLLLDVCENSLERLVDVMIAKLFRVAELSEVSDEEIKCAIFANDSVNLLTRTIQGVNSSEEYDESWLCCTCNLPTLQRRHVAIARLKQPANFGRTSHDVRLFIMILCPSKEKGTKNALETGRTFSTIFSDMEFRHSLLEAHTEEEFKRLILKQAQDLSEQQSNTENRPIDTSPDPDYEYVKEKWISFGNGIRDDLSRRLPHYLADYTDGIVGYKTIQKTVSTTLFLYFACILPAIAFGVLNHHITGGIIDVKKVIVGQTLGELSYAILCGQPLNILLTTAPLCLFVKIIYGLAEDFEIVEDFPALYCCAGLWSSFFTAIYALFDMSRLMKWSTRSTEEIFALFISIAFCVDAFRDTVKNFQDNYFCGPSKNTTILRNSMSDTEGFAPINHSWVGDQLGGTMHAGAGIVTTVVSDTCHRDQSVLFLFLMLGTLWLGNSLYNFNKTPYLQASKREALSDYALPVAVIVLTFVGTYLFRDIELEQFKYVDNDVFVLPNFRRLSWTTIFCSAGLGFSLSLLIFMDQNITSAMVNNPCNKLKKGPAFHWDLMVVALINVACSLFTFPLMHATLPHSPLHMRSLADVEERVDQGHVYEIIVRVRETRLTGIFSHVLIGLSVFTLPYQLGLTSIPVAVLDGLFLYMALTSLNGNQMFERITLLFMEQAAYPPNHYIRRVPQRKIHQFTFCQVFQLFVMCIVGFVLPWPYVKMAFPITLFLLLPIRHQLIPKLIEQRFLDALDGEHQ